MFRVAQNACNTYEKMNVTSAAVYCESQYLVVVIL